ncbi:MAG: type II toxin-antitoxin system PemK/MazF family toxin [Deltaproteobacteria bacterium]|nr:type II toxin-antitoxin system PemK/MazF family toxin [Deltaproteobacteria bacterium]
MKRGEIWWAALAEPAGSAPVFSRPVLVVQAEPFNESRIRTVVVAAMTANVRLAEAPGNVLVRKRESRLPEDSVVNVSQLLTLDKSHLRTRVGRLTPSTLILVDNGLRLVLGV